MRIVDRLDSYLGLPLTIGKNKTNVFRFLLDRFSTRIKGWSKRLLSRGGKEVFSKAMLQSIPTYVFLVFLMPKGITDEMVAKAQNFWWESKHRGRGWAMMSWDTTPKGMRGMGFKDMRLFNITLIGRQLWRLIDNRDTLCYKFLALKYFEEGDPLHPKYVDKPSYAWSSMVFAAKQLASRFGWQVDDGNTIDISIHNWGMEGLNGNSLVRAVPGDRRLLARNLWTHDGNRWDEDKV